jgi:phenylacetate-CoA ligase
MQSETLLKFNDPRWETLSRPKRSALVTELIVHQLEFARAEVPFYTKLYKGLNASDLTDMEDCAAHIPTVSKSQIRQLPSPYDLIPKSVRAHLDKLWLHRGTGGTTGTPTSVFFTKGDFDANIDGNMRVTRLAKTNGQLIAFDGYNQGHISGPYFDEVARRLGAVVVTRNFGSVDAQAIQQMKLHDCNCIIGPPVSTHKGGSIQDLLEADVTSGTNYINGDHIKLLIMSSTGISKELYEELTQNGIKAMVNIYGSTDVCTTAVSPPNDPFELILTFGHNAPFIIKPGQGHVKHNERGLLVASRIGSYDEHGNVVPNQGTQLINFHLGDNVLYKDRCSVEGWTLGGISDVQRVAMENEKLEAGCEVW